MPQKRWIDFRQQQRQAHLVSAVVFPPRAAVHLRRLRNMLNELIEQEISERAFATAIVRNAEGAEIHCGFADKNDADRLTQLMKARTATAQGGWSSHRFFRLSADKEVTLAGMLAPKDGR
jgi:hypothetical protein